ncbi:ComF family protein [Ethanoligenens harbinense]|uniref:Phosphoribosyltransferase n=1 Tax=Ethanoligenens harbinense (strain DSM 18485 / JCM 12961 / CGMCC 1.5033 / YUAN-3) TaxID=663278 RepID=E6U2X0_ETHHY|nr:double zinc ribbon domain-containing protein [Ethanoligenens harbinense]ADU26337.1 phosphoribosyltransferase [Ethanoligenens harbinense YUAN-3]AVQ95469.1 ComF family protein [Ethanoligenens harbinense YUAN-3]AYF38134.1 ComF family protein [Ethanoligenens harbinense]AYF40879.1 ComF family protein [Ethanoligenens harbinense]QCN91710.1 ComF family protein [Ethanoligenens harbinense]
MSLLERVAGVLFPARCVFCGAVVPQGTFACPACAGKAPRVEEPVCSGCGRGKAFCACRRSFAFSACAAAYYYEDAVKRGIARLKFHGHPGVAAGFAALALPAARRVTADAAVDLVTAVPLSRKGLRARGYNQSTLFARALAGHLTLPYAETLQKPFDTKPQHTCGGTERWGNVFGAFAVCTDVQGKRILLADDILTTGATLHECARILMLAGAADVRCIAVACVR